MDTIYYILIGGAIVIVWGIKTHKISVPHMGYDERIDIQPQKEFGLNVRELDVIDCPDGFVRFDGARKNHDGKWDILGTDGRWLRGIDPNVNFLPLRGENLLIHMAGTGRIRCNVRISDGLVIPWEVYDIQVGNVEYMSKLLAKKEQENMNLQQIGLSVHEGPTFFKNLEDVTKNLGDGIKRLGYSRTAGIEGQETRLKGVTLPYAGGEESGE